ncbi:MAG: ankyrin repeat domain-containing protein [Alphaproteobacteria bacterium]|nr:ankyrin repeat domain-containing protein [Alphaproteobacteria bacterium]
MFYYVDGKKTKVNDIVVNRWVGIDWDKICDPFSLTTESIDYVEKHLFSGHNLVREYGLQKLKLKNTDQTVFMFDCNRDNAEIYQIFPMRSVPVNAQDIYGKTGPMYAAQSNALKMLEVMKKNKGLIDFNLRDNNGYNLLDTACLNGSEAWCRFAFENTASAEHAKNKTKETPLMLAVRGATEESKNMKTISFLCSKKPNFKAQNVFGQTIEDYLEKAPLFVKGFVKRAIEDSRSQEPVRETPVAQTTWNLTLPVNITVKGMGKERE